MRVSSTFVALLGANFVHADYSGGDDVVVLTSGNFKNKVLNSDELWMVEFYAPWCGHCQRLEPEWKKLAKELKGTVNVGAVDMTQHQDVGAPYGIKGFPTIKFFGYNKNKPSDYQGARSADAMGDEAFKQLRKLTKDKASGGKSSGGGGGSSGGKKSGGGSGGGNKNVVLTDSNFRDKVINGGAPWLVEFYAPELHQLTSKKVLEDDCNNAQICAIAFLPHILDDTAKGRNDRLAMIRGVIEVYKRKKWGWLWAEAAQQPELEKQLNINDFPNVIVVNPRKHVSVKMLQGFHKSGIEEFFRNIAYGKTGTAVSTFDEFAEIAEVAAWDGKDGEVLVDDADEDLDDFDWGDEDEEFDQWGRPIDKDEL